MRTVAFPCGSPPFYSAVQSDRNSKRIKTGIKWKYLMAKNVKNLLILFSFCLPPSYGRRSGLIQKWNSTDKFVEIVLKKKPHFKRSWKLTESLEFMRGEPKHFHRNEKIHKSIFTNANNCQLSAKNSKNFWIYLMHNNIEPLPPEKTTTIKRPSILFVTSMLDQIKRQKKSLSL